MVGEVDVSTDENTAMLLAWHQNDGTKEGLKQLPQKPKAGKAVTPTLIHVPTKRKKKRR